MKKTVFILFIFSCLNGFAVPKEQEKSVLALDTVKVVDVQGSLIVNDSLTISAEKEKSVLFNNSLRFKPDPKRSLWLGAIIPGFGQIVNKKYWKLPFVYGGFMGFAYAISWNHQKYQTYKNAYIDISDNDPKTNSHIDVLPRGYTLATYPGGESTYKARLNSAQNQFHQYRDLSIILSVVYYAVVLLDAYVDAELYDFDVSPNLSLDIRPAQITTDYAGMNTTTFGLKYSINL